MSGIDIARSFYADAVAPLLAGTRHAAALLGDGSEVFGYDDRVSTDHDFGPRLQLFVADGADQHPVDVALRRGLPEEYAGYPVVSRGAESEGAATHRVAVTTAALFFAERLGLDPCAGLQLADWLLMPTQRLASLTAGEVFHDPEGWLSRRRRLLSWYPDDVWRYVLAAGWLRIAQEQAFVGRAGATGDELSSRVVAARVARDLVRIAFLVERRWAPYGKWLGRAFAELRLGVTIGPHLHAALVATEWRTREEELCAAASVLVDATNALRLAAPIDPSPRAFFERDIRIVDAEGVTTALCSSIADSELTTMLDRLGQRPPGAIDQAVDSTDVLTSPERCRAAASVLGLLDPQ